MIQSQTKLQYKFKITPQYFQPITMRAETSKQMAPTNLAKKAQLLRQKILTNASIIHNSYQCRIEQLMHDQQQAEARLNCILEQFQIKLVSVGQKYQSDLHQLGFYYQNYQTNINESEINAICRESLACERVRNYLNTEKGLLKQVLDQKQQPQPAERVNIHSLVRKKHLEQILEAVQISQLEKQVKYLSTHVINSSGIIYVPDNQISESEEEELKNKVHIHLAEVQRLVSLESVCESTRFNHNSKDKSHIMGILDSQEKRLAKVFEMLTTEKQTAKALQTSLEEWMERLKSPPKYHGQSSMAGKLIGRPVLTSPHPGQIDYIINNGQFDEAVSNQTCLHQQLNDSLKHLRNKVKKIQ